MRGGEGAKPFLPRCACEHKHQDGIDADNEGGEREDRLPTVLYCVCVLVCVFVYVFEWVGGCGCRCVRARACAVCMTLL